MRILILEDDDTLRGYIHKALTEQGYVVDQASSAKTAAKMAQDATYDLFLLDVRLPDSAEDGNWVVRTLRQCGHRAAIIMLTGQGGEEDKILSFQAGADDYIVKPFKITELFARVGVWRRRYREFLSRTISSTELTAKDLHLNVYRRQAVRGGKTINLTEGGFKILERLLSRKGQVVTQSELSELIRDAHIEHNSNAVEAAIKRLRDRLDEGFEKSIITTVVGSGYTIEE